MKNRTIALIGNPNSGKTTIFNSLTGANQRIGNWPGVTVEQVSGSYTEGKTEYTVIDLPGIYSFTAKSRDQRIARDYVLGNTPDCVVNIVDGTNLERNLYLTVQLVEMRAPVVLVINMADIAAKRGITFNLDAMETVIGCPVIAVSGIESKDTVRIKKLVENYTHNGALSDRKITYPNEIEQVLADWEKDLVVYAEKKNVPVRWAGIKILEEDASVTTDVIANTSLEKKTIETAMEKLNTILAERPEMVLADYRYGFISSLMAKTVNQKEAQRSMTDAIDTIVMHPSFGIPVFFAVMYVVFWVTMNLGTVFIDFFDSFTGLFLVDGLAALLEYIHTPDILITFLAHGIGEGIRTVSTFVPVVFLMFFMLSILEDSGYMARAAYVMDRFMQFIGLPGKAFVPMIVGFGCSVPAIMASRILDSRRDRILTIFLTPMMSCSARLPVYAVFTAALFKTNGGLIVFSLYFAGILMAIATGFLLKSTLLKGETSLFLMELPSYHKPRLKHIMLHSWLRLKVFLVKAGKIIVIAVAFLSILNAINIKGKTSNDGGQSVLSILGKTVQPVFEPMGIEEDNWPAVVGIFTGMLAKETVIGTANVLYSQMETTAAAGQKEEFDFVTQLKASLLLLPEGLISLIPVVSDDEQEAEAGTFNAIGTYFNPFSAYAYLLFVLLYFPCVGALAAAYREIGLPYMIIMTVYLTVLAWMTGTIFYQITAGHSPLFIALPLLMGIVIWFVFYIIGRKKINNIN